jgi:hypothetical protein
MGDLHTMVLDVTASVNQRRVHAQTKSKSCAVVLDSLPLVENTNFSLIEVVQGLLPPFWGGRRKALQDKAMQRQTSTNKCNAPRQDTPICEEKPIWIDR